MEAFLEIVQSTLADWWLWGETLARAMRQEALIGLVAVSLLVGGFAAHRLNEFGFFGRLFILLAVSAALFVFGLAMSQAVPVLVNPDALVRSQVTPQ